MSRIIMNIAKAASTGAFILVVAGFFIGLVYLAPSAFIAFGKAVDAPRCFIGMKEYCDRDYSNVEELFGTGKEQK
jgi:hypothetical protein